MSRGGGGREAATPKNPDMWADNPMGGFPALPSAQGLAGLADRAGGWGPQGGGRHARPIRAVAVGAPVGGLPAALARDAAPHLHRDARLGAPPDVAAQLLGGPFCDPREAQRGNKVRSPMRPEKAAQSHPLGRGTTEMTSRAGLQPDPWLC